MIVDCDRCEVRGGACQDCVITLLLGAPPSGVELDGAERQALDALAEADRVPHLQLADRHEDQQLTLVGTHTGAHLRKGAEWSADGGERSRRHVS